jgi:hypothetical protein
MGRISRSRRVRAGLARQCRGCPWRRVSVTFGVTIVVPCFRPRFRGLLTDTPAAGKRFVGTRDQRSRTCSGWRPTAPSSRNPLSGDWMVREPDRPGGQRGSLRRHRRCGAWRRGSRRRGRRCVLGRTTRVDRARVRTAGRPLLPVSAGGAPEQRHAVRQLGGRLARIELLGDLLDRTQRRDRGCLPLRRGASGTFQLVASSSTPTFQPRQIAAVSAGVQHH